MAVEWSRRNLLLIAPVAAQGVAAIALIGAGVLGWGSTGRYSLVPWGPTFTGVFLGGFVLVGTTICVRRLVERLQQPARFAAPMMALGLAASLLLTFIVASASTVVGDEERYARTWDRDPTAAAGETTEALDPEVVIFVTVVIAFPGPISWLLYGVHEAYVGGIRPISTEVEGVDPMGQIMGSV